MSKYHRELKLCIAQRYIDGEHSRQLSKEFSISSRQIRYWGQVFVIHGSYSFLPTTHSQNTQTKLSALNLMWTNSWSLTHTSAFLNISSPGILSVWLNRYKQDGIKGLETHSRGRSPVKIKPTPKPDDEMTTEELQQELIYLRAENAVLKKLEELKREKQRQIKTKH